MGSGIVFRRPFGTGIGIASLLAGVLIVGAVAARMRKSDAPDSTGANSPRSSVPVLRAAPAADGATSPTIPDARNEIKAATSTVAPQPTPQPVATPTAPPVSTATMAQMMAAALAGQPMPLDANVTSAGQVCFVFTGSRRSELEPCGCHDKQTGGVDREAYLYEQWRKMYSSVIAMEAGSWVDPFQSPNERLKTDFLVKSLNAMDFKVYNVTPYDLAFGTTHPLQLVEGGRGKLISANVQVLKSDGRTTQAVLPYDPYTILEAPMGGGQSVRVGVIGITHPASLEEILVQRLKGTPTMPKFTVLDANETLKRVVPEVRKQADYVIVLAMMNRMTAPATAAAVEGIDMFVTTWGVQSLQQNMTFGTGKAIVNTGFLGRYTSRQVVAFDKGKRPVQVTGTLADIPSDGQRDKEVTKYLDEYLAKTKELFAQMQTQVQNSRFVGRIKCLNCHRQAYLQWIRTPHNLAFATLVEKRQHYNPDCLKCHVTGGTEKDGFIDTMQTGHLVSVQCEVCHGPGKEHVEALTNKVTTDAQGNMTKLDPNLEYPRLIVTPPPALCVQCHDPDHDPSFDYEQDLKLVSHKNVEGPFQRPDKATTSTMMMK